MPSRMVYLVYIQDSFERVLSVFEIVSCQVACQTNLKQFTLLFLHIDGGSENLFHDSI